MRWLVALIPLVCSALVGSGARLLLEDHDNDEEMFVRAAKKIGGPRPPRSKGIAKSVPQKAAHPKNSARQPLRAQSQLKRIPSAKSSHKAKPQKKGGSVTNSRPLRNQPTVSRSRTVTPEARPEARPHVAPLPQFVAKPKVNPAGWGWYIVKFEREDIGESMAKLSCAGESAKGTYVPPDLGGVWWQDRNPNPQEQAMSFGQATWDPGPEGCRKTTIPFYTDEEKQAGIIKGPVSGSVPCLGRLSFFVYDHRTWAYSPYTLNEGMAQSAALGHKMYVDMVCGGPDVSNLTLCKVSPEIGSQALYRAVDTVANTLVNFPTEYYQVKMNNDLWVRYSGYRGKTGADYLSKGVYFLKRVVGCDGSKTRYWDEFSAGGQSTDIDGPDMDVFGHPVDYRLKESSKVPDKLWIRAHGPTDKENGGGAASSLS